MSPLASRVAQRETPIADYLPYSHHVTDSIVATHNGDYLLVMRLRGRTFETNSTLEHKQWVEQINIVMCGFRSDPVSYWTHVVRSKAGLMQNSSFHDPWCMQYNAAYTAQWIDKQPLVNELYLTVVLRPDVDPALAKFAALERRSAADIEAWQNEAIGKLDNMKRVLVASLREYVPEVLATYSHNEQIFSEPAEFLGLLVNGRRCRVPLTSGFINEDLPRSRPFFGKWGQVGELRDANWTRRFGALEVFRFGNRTKPAHIDTLLKLPFEFVLSQSFSTLFKAKARDAFKRQGRFLRDAKDDGVSQIEELNLARDQLADDKFVVGEHDLVMIIWGESNTQIQQRQADAISRLADSGIVAKAITVAIEAAWWSQLPGNWRWRLRPRVITSLNFLSLAPFHNYLYGKPTGNPWGEAATVFRTEASTATYFSYHASEEFEDALGKRNAGNTSVIGETGTGKTVLLGHLIAQTDKFDATQVVFDHGRGLQVACMAMGGLYYPLALGSPTGWNPLQLDLSPGNMLFIRDWLILLCELVDGPLGGSDKELIASKMEHLQSLPREGRRLSVFNQFIPNPRVETSSLSVHQRLQQWCSGGQYGWVFDNESDTLDMDTHRLFGFDLTEFLPHPIVGSAAQFYLLHRTESMLDGRRFCYVFDEVQNPLQYPWFQHFIQEKVREIRKQNGVVVFATQEPDAIARSPVGKSLIQQSATQVFLPNTKATPADYIEDFRLTPAEFEVVRKLGKHSRKFLIKQDGAVVTANLDLSALADAINIFSGSADKAALAEAAVHQHGPIAANWIPAYLVSLTPTRS